ncbi:MAG: D-hexose-6-phosphate mutarotase [Armatimonadota bacterium]
MRSKLSSKYAMPGLVSLVEDIDGMPKIVLTHRSGSSAEIFIQGAHITSWKDHRGEEQLFLSRMSDFKPGSPIRGGIPVVFPQFGDGPLPKHGFARVMDWHLSGSSVASGGDVSVTLSLSDTEETHKIWDYRFSPDMVVTLGVDSLSVRMSVSNTGNAPFDYQIALHTYFGISDIHSTAVCGLNGVEYLDSLQNRLRMTEPHLGITFDGEVDRIYLNTPDTLIIVDETVSKRLIIRKSGMPDAVVWNPWIDKSIRLTDFGDDEYQQMVCVETGAIIPGISLSPGERWTGETVLNAENG